MISYHNPNRTFGTYEAASGEFTLVRYGIEVTSAEVVGFSAASSDRSIVEAVFVKPMDVAAAIAAILAHARENDGQIPELELALSVNGIDYRLPHGVACVRRADVCSQPRLFEITDFDHHAVVTPFANSSLTDVRAFAIDPDPHIRLAVATSQWNHDIRVETVLCNDPDERVVLALLGNIDPCAEVCDLIINGPHPAAREVLARRNLPTELLERLAKDTDPAVSDVALHALANRAGIAYEPKATTR